MRIEEVLKQDELSLKEAAELETKLAEEGEGDADGDKDKSDEPFGGKKAKPFSMKGEDDSDEDESGDEEADAGDEKAEEESDDDSDKKED